jgi:spore coat protein U-like protein
MIRGIAAALLAALTGQSAWAADCRLDATPMSFGGYVGSQPATSTADLRVTCHSLTAEVVNFSIRPSAGFTGDPALTGGQGRLSYRLYLDPAFSQPLTAASAGISGRLTLTAGQSQTAVYTLYGRAPSRQVARAGAYGDTIGLELTVW